VLALLISSIIKVNFDNRQFKHLLSCEVLLCLPFGWWVGFGVEYCYLLMYFVEADKNSVRWGGLCVGTRQALLQGLLLCVGFVCLANVPDLVRWVVSAKSWMFKCLQDVV
jgi:hypothetical protein